MDDVYLREQLDDDIADPSPAVALALRRSVTTEGFGEQAVAGFDLGAARLPHS